MPKSVDALLEDIRLLGEEQHQIVQAVRTLVRASVPSVTEEVKYGGILFTSGVAFCGVFAYKAHVSVEFSHGAKMQGVEALLEGAGKGRRHVKLTTLDELATRQLARLLPLAREAAQSAT